MSELDGSEIEETEACLSNSLLILMLLYASLLPSSPIPAPNSNSPDYFIEAIEAFSEA